MPEALRSKLGFSTANLSGDIAGGVTASVLALPESIAYGMLAFAPLGAGYLAAGAVAGLVALAFSSLGAAGWGGSRIITSGPYSASAVILASALTLSLREITKGDAEAALTVLALVVFLGGVIQVLFGVFKIGKVATCIPQPVSAGLINGTALLILGGQVRPMLGLSRESGGAFDPSAIQPLTLVVGMTTALVTWFGPRITRRIPAPFMGIVAGTASYYGLQLLAGSARLSGTIGHIPAGIPTPSRGLATFELIVSPRLPASLGSLVTLAFGVAIVVSINLIIASVSTDKLLRERSNTNREFIGQGFGNMLAAVFGGITSAASTSRSVANHQYGGRTPTSRLAGGLFSLGVLAVLGPIVGRIPNVALAATLVVIGVRGLDAAILRLAWRQRSSRTAIDLMVSVGVTALMVFVSPSVAVVAGVGLSVILFTVRMGRGIIRRSYRGGQVQSNVERPLREIDVLEREGGAIRVFELEGPLFFGTADKLGEAIDAAVGVSTIILDFARVTEIDSTGTEMILRIRERCAGLGQELLISAIDGTDRHAAARASLDAARFDSIDDALAAAEDRLLNAKLGEERQARDVPLEELDLASGLSAEHVERLGSYLVPVDLSAGETLFQKGDAGDRLLAIARGRVSISVQPGERRTHRVLCAGTVLGEMAIISGTGLRSATAVAQTDLRCLSLTVDALDRIHAEEPLLGRELLRCLARALSRRIRIADRIATELKA